MGGAMRILGQLLRVAATAYAVLCAVLFVFQRALIYYPQPSSGARGGTLMTLPGVDERVLVTTLPREGERALIYFGGNAEDVAMNLPEFRSVFSGYSIYLLHYRGYGGSGGRPTEDGLVGDGMALYDYVRRQHSQ